MLSSYLLVAAIDIGTSHSGFAFSFNDDYKGNPLNITHPVRLGRQGLSSIKIPTCVLFNPDGKFHSFGFDAQDKYLDLARAGDHGGWYYFRRFKTTWYDKMDEVIKDETGKPMKASKVFSSAIGYLKDELLRHVNQKQPNVKESEIRWVLTVPAISNDFSKRFMRDSADEAGILGNNLMVAVEPETAVLYCSYLSVESFDEDKGAANEVFLPGSKLLVLDVGGNSITALEIQAGFKFNELHNVSFDATRVDGAFRLLLDDIFGTEVMLSFESDCKSDALELERDFDIKKTTITPETTYDVVFRIPTCLVDTLQEITGKEITAVFQSQEKYTGKLTIQGDKMRMSADLARQLFDEFCNETVNLIGDVLREPSCRDVETILMVGGISESPMLRAAIERNFLDFNIVIPEEKDEILAVLKGVVIYGHKQG